MHLAKSIRKNVRYEVRNEWKKGRNGAKDVSVPGITKRI